MANAQTVDLTRLTGHVAQSDVIGRGDVLEITISAGLTAEDTVTFPVRVNDYGQAVLTQIGPVTLEGLDFEEAEAAVSVACEQAGLFTAPHVTVTCKRRNMYEITVTGAVEMQGTYPIPAGSADLLHAIVAAGGLAEDAGTNVEIRQTRGPSRNEPAVAGMQGTSDYALAGHTVAGGGGMPQVVTVNLASISENATTNYRLEDGAVVMVETRDPAALQVLGLVTKPNVYEYPIGENLRVLGALAMAGGRSNPVANRILVVRQDPQTGEQAVIQVNYNKAKDDLTENLLLQPGDMVIVDQTAATTFLETIRTIGFTIGGSVF
ncbi:MAG: SLBB domain-containing protein [Thermomicrobiales bacterium]